jgi:monoamine oxidase
LDRIGIKALAGESEASGKIEGDKSFRIAGGYDKIVQWLARELESRQVPFHCGVKVETIRWNEGEVIVDGLDFSGVRRFEGAKAIITVPLGVLKSGDVMFEPEIAEKRAAIEGLEMGHIVKVILQFRARLWPEENFGFVHSCDEWFPTWWSNEAPNVLTGWAGGPKARRMEGMDKESIVAQAVRSASNVFGVPESTLQDQLAAAHFHDWSSDPFSLGAYSYVPVGMLETQRTFSKPVSNTLFFAGEATTLDAQPGTVHGAIHSGRHAAMQVLKSPDLKLV